MIRAVIFDFDGLIVDTESATLLSWQEVYDAHGQELRMMMWGANVGRGMTWDPMEHLRGLVDHDIDAEAVERGRRARQLALVEAKPILPGVEARMAEAKSLGMRLGVATSSSRAWVEGHLQRLGLLERFDAVRSWNDPDVGARKPDPAVYVAALRALGAAPSEAIALEDSSNGVLAATRAGIFTVAVPNDVTRPMGVGPADVTLASLADATLASLAEVAARARAKSP